MAMRDMRGPKRMPATVLIVDDEPAQRRLARVIVERAGYGVVEAESGREGLDYLESGEPVDAVILDHSMPDMTGIEVLESLRPERPDLPIIMLTAHSSVKISVDALKAGASDFLLKPAKPDKIVAALETALDTETPAELKPLTEKLEVGKGFEAVVGKAPAFREALDIAQKAARRNVPVLIEGESGAGKEVVAQAIHSASPRAAKPLVVVNCGAIPENLVESVLFGHEKGAFTGASQKHVGRFVEADGGTLFLDEIGELPLGAQVKLLRALQTGQIEPVGANGHQTVDVRIVAATNRELKTEVAQGRFREDLYYRLGVVPITIPPLRERREDIPALAEFFVRQLHEEGDIAPQAIDADAVDMLCRHNWPGNVRQLQNALFRAGVLCENRALTAADFPDLGRALGVVAPVAARGNAASNTNIAQIAPPPAMHHALDAAGHMRPLAELEAAHIRMALKHYRGQMSEVARRLGIGRSTLYRKLGEYALEEDQNAAAPVPEDASGTMGT